MTTYAILHRGDPERCIRFFRQYCKVWSETDEWTTRYFFKNKSDLEKYPYCKIDSHFDNPRVSDTVAVCETFIDFENNPRRRAL